MQNKSQYDGEALISTALIFSKGDFDPGSITKLLNLSPTQTWLKGDQKSFKSGKQFVYPWSGWKLALTDKQFVSIEEQLGYWANLLSSKILELARIKELSCNCAIDCCLIANESIIFSLDPDLIKQYSYLGVEIAFTFVFGSGD